MTVKKVIASPVAIRKAVILQWRSKRCGGVTNSWSAPSSKNSSYATGDNGNYNYTGCLFNLCSEKMMDESTRKHHLVTEI